MLVCCAQQPEMIVVFRRERILEEEQAIRLQRLAQVDRLIQVDALVDVVQQLDLVAELGAHVLEELRQHPHVRSGSQIARGLVGPIASSRISRRVGYRGPRTVARVAGRRHLHAHVAEAPLHAGARVLFDLGEAVAARVVVAVGAVTHLAAEQLIERHAGALALDVPERHVDAAHRVEQHRAVAPVPAHVARLPDVLDLVDVAADQERPQILVDRRFDDERALRERGTAPAHQAGLGGLHLHQHQPDPVGCGEDRLDVADLHRSGPLDRLCVGGRGGRHRAGDGRRRERPAAAEQRRAAGE